MHSARQYLLPCSCGQTIPVRTTQAGETVRCACGKDILIPAYREILALEPASDGKSTPSRSRWRWTRRHQRLLIGSLITAVAAALLGYTYASRPRPADVETLPLQLAWPYWQELRQGLDRYPSPGEQKYVKAMNKSRLGQGILLSVTAAGLLFTAVSFITRPQRSRGGARQGSRCG